VTVSDAIFLLLFAVLLWLLWRILRCLEWLTMFVQGFSEKFVETSRQLRQDENRLTEEQRETLRKIRDGEIRLPSR
jgi:hypothetical protein